jgi:hypothetical protein
MFSFPVMSEQVAGLTSGCVSAGVELAGENKLRFIQYGGHVMQSPAQLGVDFPTGAWITDSTGNFRKDSTQTIQTFQPLSQARLTSSAYITDNLIDIMRYFHDPHGPAPD